MSPEIFGDVDFDAHRVDELSPTVIREVARRLSVSTTFATLVYRESELDALFTLCDLEVGQLVRRGDVTDNRSLEIMRRVLAHIVEAHDRTHRTDHRSAVALLDDAADLLEILSR